MPNKASTVYQSGESVIIAGTYEVVGVDRSVKAKTGEFAIRELEAGEHFPNYSGRAVAWHLIQQRPGSFTTDVNQTPG